MITYSYTFVNMQGEGHYTGVPSAWIRLFGCSLQCEGFGQKDPTDPSSYHLPYKDADISDVKSVKDLPVFETGCDSSYSWSARYKHLMNHKEAPEVVEEIRDQMKSRFNPDGKFQSRHMCFTGGEPLLKPNQKACKEILEEFIHQDDIPPSITFETNGIQKVNEELFETLEKYKSMGGEVFMSISPKLFHVSGEKEKKAIKEESIQNLIQCSDNYQLKFVLADTDEAWDYFDALLDRFDKSMMMPGFDYDKVWVMPVGATDESQYNIARTIADRTLERGLKVAARVHSYIYGNEPAT